MRLVRIFGSAAVWQCGTAELQNCGTAELQNCRTAELRNCGSAELQNDKNLNADAADLRGLLRVDLSGETATNGLIARAARDAPIGIPSGLSNKTWALRLGSSHPWSNPRKSAASAFRLLSFRSSGVPAFRRSAFSPSHRRILGAVVPAPDQRRTLAVRVVVSSVARGRPRVAVEPRPSGDARLNRQLA